MSWQGPALDTIERDLAGVIDALAAAHTQDVDDREDNVAALGSEIAELGLWTIGVPEDVGGGGADRTTTVVALERLGRYWPALGWASAQAHAAAIVLHADERTAPLVEQVNSAAARVAVVDAAGPHVRLGWSGDRLVGHVDRIDAAAAQPHLLLLDGDTALFVPADRLETSSLSRTGMSGALTRGAVVDVARQDLRCIEQADISSARDALLRGAGSVAAGIAAAAADQALAYASSRHQFGDVLTAIPTVRKSVLEQSNSVSSALHAVLGAEGLLQLTGAARRACDVACEVAAAALQSHGGYGYLTEYPAERYLRDAVSLRAACDVYSTGDIAARALVGRSSRSGSIVEVS